MDYSMRSIIWEMVKDELAADEKFSDLADWIQRGCSGPGESLSTHIKPFWRTKLSLHCEDGVPMFADRTIIPKRLREEVKQTLHAGHQGVLAMGLRAEESVFWPNIWYDLERVRQSCRTCHKIAPS